MIAQTVKKEIPVPKHDNVILRLIPWEEKTEEGIILARPGDYEHLKTEKEARESARNPKDPRQQQTRPTDRYEVLAVGPGRYIDVADDIEDDVFLRKPMECEVGDIVIAQGGPKPFPINGEYLYCAQDWQILAKIVVDGETGQEVLAPCHDYIFSVPSKQIMKSTGGIYMPGAEDVTGNQTLPVRFIALGVGDGPWALRYERGQPPRFARRPMSVQAGQEFNFDGRGFGVHMQGGTMVCTQDFQTAIVFAEAA